MISRLATMLIDIKVNPKKGSVNALKTMFKTIEDMLGRIVMNIGRSFMNMFQNVFTFGMNVFSALGQAATSMVTRSLDLSAQQSTRRAELFALMGRPGQGAANVQFEAFVKELKDLALNTTSSVESVFKWASMLKAVGLDNKQIIQLIKDMGDITGGNRDVMNRMLMNVGQIFSNARAFGLDIKQFGFAGIPIKQYLAQAKGVSVQTIGEMVTAGTIGFNEIINAFFEMTKPGGPYHKRMETVMKTYEGRKSVVQNKLAMMLTEAGRPLQALGLRIFGELDTMLNRWKEDGSLTRFMENVAEAFGVLWDTVSRIFGVTEATQTLDAVGNWLIWLGEKIELLSFLLFGIPQEWKDQGMTADWIYRQLGVGKANQKFIEEQAARVKKFFQEIDWKAWIEDPLGKASRKGGELLGAALFNLLKYTIKELLLAPFRLIAGLINILHIPTWLLNKKIGSEESVKAYDEVVAKTHEFATGGPIMGTAQAVGMGLFGGVGEMGSQAWQSMFGEDKEEKEQEENVKKEGKESASNVNINIYTDEAKNEVIAQLNSFYGEMLA